MSGAQKPRAKAGKASSPPLPNLPLSECEIAKEKEIARRLQELIVLARQRNLNNAVWLAQQAARGVGPLVDHFCELGRRYNHLVGAAPPKPGLRLVKGGAL